jgi:glycosyltransferase involved in cell wall biosynthesis
MCILHLITSLEPGGAQSVLLARLKQFVRNGENVTDHHVAYMKDDDLKAKFEGEGFCIHHLGASLPKMITSFVNLVRTLKPDVIHSSLWSANLMARIVGWWFGVPVICDMHANFSHHGRFRNLVDRFPWPLPKHFIAVSKSVQDSFRDSIAKRMFLKKHNLDAVARCSVIENGIKPDSFKFSSADRHVLRDELGISGGTFVVGAVARLVPVKRFTSLIEAFGRFLSCAGGGGNSKLIIVGDGPLMPNLKSLAKKYDVSEDVIFTGYRSDVYRFYSAFDCLAVTSSSEGLSITLLEALASGLPVVTTSVDGWHDAIVHGQNGFIIECGDIDGMSSSLLVLSRRRVLSGSNRPSMLPRKNNIDHAAASYLDLYHDVSGTMRR